MGVEAETPATTTTDSIKKLKTGPPYTCPVEKCGRTYKSNCGLQYHLKSYDHDNPTPQTTPQTPSTPRGNKKGSKKVRGTPSNKSACKTPAIVAASETVGVLHTEPLTFDEVLFEVDGQCVKVNINETLEVCAKEKNSVVVEDGEKKETHTQINLPEAVYHKLENYNICDAPPRPNAYIRFIEKSAEELDGEVNIFYGQV